MQPYGTIRTFARNRIKSLATVAKVSFTARTHFPSAFKTQTSVQSRRQSSVMESASST